jgi:sRNA-binding carbon storage regulator CsrA
MDVPFDFQKRLEAIVAGLKETERDLSSGNFEDLRKHLGTIASSVLFLAENLLKEQAPIGNDMTIVERHVGESLSIKTRAGPIVQMKILKVARAGTEVKLGFLAPSQVVIERGEVRTKIRPPPRA